VIKDNHRYEKKKVRGNFCNLQNFRIVIFSKLVGICNLQNFTIVIFCNLQREPWRNPEVRSITIFPYIYLKLVVELTP